MPDQDYLLAGNPIATRLKNTYTPGLAITALKNYSKLINNNNLVDDEVSSHRGTETDAGSLLASDSMKQITDSSSVEFGQFFIGLFFKRQSIHSYMIDISLW